MKVFKWIILEFFKKSKPVHKENSASVQDVYKRQVYTGLYRFLDSFEVVREQWPSDIRDLTQELNRMGEKVIFLGDGVPVCRHIIEETMNAVSYTHLEAIGGSYVDDLMAALGE